MPRPAPLSAMPFVRVCTLAELKAGCLDADRWGPAAAADRRLRFNQGGRVLVQVPAAAADPAAASSSGGNRLRPEGDNSADIYQPPAPVQGGELVRSVVVAAHAPAGSTDFEVFAFDRNCYHVGYPLDLGPIEDVPACSTNMRRGRGSTTDTNVVGDASDLAPRRLPRGATLRPGTLDCDLKPVPSSSSAVGGGNSCNRGDETSVPRRVVGAKAPSDDDGASSGPSMYTCVTCPLHNRIFDLRTGDMIALETSDADSTTAGPGCATVSGVVRAAPTACKQRIHKVVFLRPANDEGGSAAAAAPPNVSTGVPAGWVALPDDPSSVDRGGAEGGADDDARTWIYIVDSYGAGNPSCFPHLDGLRHVSGIALPSDRENRPRPSGEVATERKRCC